MDKYRKVEKTRESSPEEEIRVTVNGRVANYVTYAARLFNQLNHTTITVRATGRAMTTAVCVAEVVKRRFKGLHQVTTVGCTSIVDEFEPTEEGLDPIKEVRQVAFVSILLSKDEERVQMDAPGYQPPLDESMVKELDPDVVGRGFPRSRGRGRGYSGRPYGRGNGRTRGGRGGGGYLQDRGSAQGISGQREGSPNASPLREDGERGGARAPYRRGGRGRGGRGMQNRGPRPQHPQGDGHEDVGGPMVGKEPMERPAAVVEGGVPQ